ncbi:MAG: TniB family NTP-binding protein [Limnobacter sp.]|uniref:TniB family NTP-binding protein n=1 Tax=Limnobacter sp. TaxID=2003368 RepID=UPI00391D4348
MTESEKNALANFSGLVIAHSSFKRAYDTILEVIEFNKINQAPEPQSVLVLAESGEGKSTLFTHLTNTLPKRYEVKEGLDIVSKIPFFNSSIPTNATPSTMAQELFASMGVGDRNKHAAEQRIKVALKKAGTQAIFYDELNNIAGSKTPHKIGLARGYIRDLISSSGVMIVGFGLPECEEIFLAEAQVRKRFPWVERMTPFEFDLDPKSEFCIVVKTLEQAIAQSRHLYVQIEPRMNEGFLTSLYATTGGSINAIKKLYEQALKNAFDGDHILNTEKFSIAADRMRFPTSISRNGFREDRKICLTMIADRCYARR